jgi:hypothetical protein
MAASRLNVFYQRERTSIPMALTVSDRLAIIE